MERLDRVELQQREQQQRNDARFSYFERLLGIGERSNARPRTEF